MKRSIRVIVISLLAGILLYWVYWGLQYRTEQDLLEVANAQFLIAAKSGERAKYFRYEKSQRLLNGKRFMWYKRWKNSQDSVRIVVVVEYRHWGDSYWYEDGKVGLLYKLAEDVVGVNNIDALPAHNRKAILKYAAYDVCKDSI